jgi:sulfate adenylyltransferase subunit 2
MIEQNLDVIEEKAIFVLREANSKFKNMAAMWSMGKDSTAMLALARKAFLGKIPFPVIHIDNGIDFPESYRFREELAKKWNMKLIVVKSEIKEEMSGFSCCGANKTVALKKVMKEHGFDSLIVSIRRDEHGIRAKDRTSNGITRTSPQSFGTIMHQKWRAPPT